jgi:hypothetical protein
VIRNVVVHMTNEQPLLADMREMPTPTDACLVCTNLRYMNGRKPSFTDAIDSWFLIPLGMIRFIEVPRREVEIDDGPLALPAGPLTEELGEFDDLAPDEDLLRRIREA